ncbi:MAG TPA: hypothetical protein VES73_07155 [Lamprocystis sp. (in: g-proteobacteria)]|nr:hypothetical protein [Lamprocystis sp. (in: g-proteobacteria)]
MFDTPRVLSLASAAVLTLALSHGATAAAPAAPSPAAAPVAAAPVAPAPAAETAPTPADGPGQMEAMCAEHMAMREKMRNMTPEERKAMRETQWQEMRARAAARGVELPETPPWVAAEQRQQAAQEQFEKYRKTVEAMTPEQIEAARAMFGRRGPGMRGPNGPMPPMGPRPPMPPQGGYGYGYGYGPEGGTGEGGYWGGPPPMPTPGAPDQEGGMPMPPQGH